MSLKLLIDEAWGGGGRGLNLKGKNLYLWFKNDALLFITFVLIQFSSAGVKSQSAPLFYRPVKIPSLTQSQVTAGNYGLKHKISITCESTLITWLQVILLPRSNAFRYVCQVPTVCRTLKTPPASISTRLQDSVQNKAYKLARLWKNVLFCLM